MKTLTFSEKLAHKSGANDDVFLQKLTLVKAGGSRVYCNQGHAFIDMAYCSMVNVLGHNIQTIQDAITTSYDSQPQCTGLINYNAAYYKIQDTLTQHLPYEHKPLYITSHESLAVDMALKMAYLYWHTLNESQRTVVLSFAHGYHGPSFGSLGINATLPGHDAFREVAPVTEHIPFPHTWLDDPQASHKETIAYERLADYLEKNAHYVSALIIEPLLQSFGGMHVCRPTFLTRITKLVQSYGILVITDERFTALLRCGKLFASQHLSCEPDMMILGTSFTNGTIPFGATTVNKRLQQILETHLSDPNFLQAHGYHVHPTAASATAATITAIHTDAMANHVRTLHAIHNKRLRSLLQQPIIEKVRFVGCCAAFDFVCERHNQKLQLTSWFQDACARERLLIHCANQSVYLIPPLCLHADDLEKIYDTIESIIAAVPLSLITTT
jgi:adenosylmethionine-8-amino-7-oxononanoate aminotransferase